MSVLTITNNCLPVGAYRVQFVGMELTNHAEYGEGSRWTFIVTEGPFKGREVYRTTKCEPTPKNSCGRLLASLAGKKPSDGLEIDPEDFVGQTYNAIITESQGGDSTRVDAITPDA